MKTTINTMDEIQKKILGQRSQPITPLELNRLFQSPITPEFNLVLYTALQKKAIDPDLTLIQTITNSLNSDYLIPISLCLRFGADSNLYVLTPKLGTIHILGYIYIKLYEIIDPNLLNTIILLFILQGTRTSMPIFDSKAGKIRNSDEPPASSESVLDWLIQQGYNTILDQIITGDLTELEKFLDPDSLMILSLMLDKPNYAIRPYQSSDLILAIRSFSMISFDKIPTLNDKIMTDYYSLDQTVLYLNSQAFIKLLNRGQIPSYLLMNTIIINLKDSLIPLPKQNIHILMSQTLETMLLGAINIGVELDQEQFSIIRTLNPDILNRINRAYEHPYWQKVCNDSHSTQVPESLQQLARSLNMNNYLGKPALCDNIRKISKSDLQSLKTASHRRQQLRMSSELGTINEFIDDRTPHLICRNRTELSFDPFDYNDLEIAYYRDDQGVVWCFNADSFINLIETGLNPYNSTELPPNFLAQLRYQLSLLQNLPHLSLAQAIDSLTAKDIPRETKLELDNFIKEASNYGVSSNTIKSLTKDQMMHALASINYNVNLEPLTTQHALITTAQIINYLMKHEIDPNLIQDFFATLIKI